MYSSIDDFVFYIILFSIIGFGSYYWLFKANKKTNNDLKSSACDVPPTETIAPTSESKPGFINAMKSRGRNIVIFYGSQTGTAEDFATRLAKEASLYGMKAMVADPDRCHMDELSQLYKIENSLAIFCVSTYWEGDPTDNAMAFYNWLQSGKTSVRGLRYAVFGLGNSTYEYFNKMGKYLDLRLEELGGTRVHKLGLGDTAHNIDNYFMTWKDNLWTSVAKQFNLKTLTNFSSRQFRLIQHKEIPREGVFTGEVLTLNSLVDQKPPFNQKNPFLAPILVNRELYKGLRSCLHIELDLMGSQLSYEAGDYVAVYQKNDKHLVQRIGQLLATDLDQVISLENLDEDSFKRHPFPCPTSYRDALLFYTDISSAPKPHVLRELSEYTDNEEHKKFLKSISSSTEEGKQVYNEWIVEKLRNIVDVLEDMPSVKPRLDHLLEILPRLLPRFYTICSSSKVYPNSVHLTAVVVKKSTGRVNKGVATNLLASKQCEQSGDKVSVPIFIRRSQFRLPVNPETPVIMIGPGTGLAPFRGFLQERWYHKLHQTPIGPTVLYFGCRNQSDDYLYEEELRGYVMDNTLTKLYTAFSRDGSDKVYVTHLLRQHMPEIWRLIGPLNGHVYVSGYASTMAREVKDILVDTFVAEGNQSPEEAHNYLKTMESQRRYLSDVWS